ncbi:MAG: reverse transcriptase domain-containing protein, partial [bacterium]
MAVSHKTVLKNCDVKQAFVQSSLPDTETYFVKPPVGCPKSSPGTYWKLLRSLYGLRQAPKLWFEKLTAHLKSMGLRNSPNSPCLFVGTIIPGESPVYVGIYVDDIVYFSPSTSVEKKFKSLLSTIGNVDFMGQVTHFLGIEFAWNTDTTGNLHVSLTQQSFVETLLDNLGIT